MTGLILSSEGESWAEEEKPEGEGGAGEGCG